MVPGTTEALIKVAAKDLKRGVPGARVCAALRKSGLVESNVYLVFVAAVQYLRWGF